MLLSEELHGHIETFCKKRKSCYDCDFITSDGNCILYLSEMLLNTLEKRIPHDK